MNVGKSHSIDISHLKIEKISIHVAIFLFHFSLRSCWWWWHNKLFTKRKNINTLHTQTTSHSHVTVQYEQSAFIAKMKCQILNEVSNKIINKILNGKMTKLEVKERRHKKTCFVPIFCSFMCIIWVQELGNTLKS